MTNIAPGHTSAAQTAAQAKKARGRPPSGKTARTNSERQKAYRQRRQAEIETLRQCVGQNGQGAQPPAPEPAPDVLAEQQAELLALRKQLAALQQQLDRDQRDFIAALERKERLYQAQLAELREENRVLRERLGG